MQWKVTELSNGRRLAVEHQKHPQSDSQGRHKADFGWLTLDWNSFQLLVVLCWLLACLRQPPSHMEYREDLSLLSSQDCRIQLDPLLLCVNAIKNNVYLCYVFFADNKAMSDTVGTDCLTDLM